MSSEYNANQIQVLEGLEAVRMYIGSTSAKGLHHLVYEIVDNSVDEALAGFCNEITVKIHPDNSISVMDNGRGIPVDINDQKGMSARQMVFTILHAGGKFGGGGYKVSGGLHGVGASVVNALSEWLVVQVHRDGKIHGQKYTRGDVAEPLTVVGETEITGTYVHFLPDDTIFEETVFDYDVLKQRFRETAFLTKGLKINLADLREGMEQEHSFHYEGGIKEFVHFLNHSRQPLYDTIFYASGKKDGVLVEVAFQHNDGYTESIFTFVNNINTPDGGTHLVGFKSGLTKTLNDYGKKAGIIKDADKKPRVLLIGSGEEYGHIKEGECPIVEDNTVRPGNIYAATKACQNMLGKIYSDAYGLDIMMVRAFNHIGPNQTPMFVVADFCKQVADIEKGRQEPVIYVGNLSAKRDFTDVRDVVKAYALLVEHGRRGETYNVGTGHAIAISQILDEIVAMSDTAIEVKVDENKLRPVDVPIIEPDIDKIKSEVGWQPVISLEQTLKETLEHWRSVD